MFKESPTLTREQKAGGSEGGKGEGGEGRNVLIETVFEMNYRTGLWRKLQFKRPWPLTMNCCHLICVYCNNQSSVTANCD